MDIVSYNIHLMWFSKNNIYSVYTVLLPNSNNFLYFGYVLPD